MNKPLLILFILFTSCLEKVDIESSDPNQRLLIVDGGISNLPGPYTVEVSVSTSKFTNPNNFSKPFPVLDANMKIVRVSDQHEEPVIHSVDTPGMYTTHPLSLFRGEIGESYYLRIEVDEEVFTSTRQFIKNPVKIDTIYAHFNEKNEVVDVFVDLADPIETNYYQWTWNGFREVHSILPPEDEGNFQGLGCKPYIFADCCNMCFLSFSGKEINLMDDRFVNGQNLTKNHVAEVDVPHPNDYLIEVQQFTISEEYHEFLRLLTLQQESEGSLFDPPPFRIEGNISKVGGDGRALGFFSAAGADEAFIQFNADKYARDKNSFELCDDCRTFHPLADTAKPKNWR